MKAFEQREALQSLDVPHVDGRVPPHLHSTNIKCNVKKKQREVCGRADEGADGLKKLKLLQHLQNNKF